MTQTLARVVAIRRLIIISFSFAAAMLVVALLWFLVDAPGGKTLPSVILGLVTSPVLLREAAWFVVVYFGVHMLLAAAWYVVWVHGTARWLPAHDLRGSTELGFYLLLIWVLMLNAGLFPASTLSPTLPGWMSGTAHVVWVVFTITLCLVMFGALIRWVVDFVVAVELRRHVVVVGASTAITVIALFYFQPLRTESHSSGAAREFPDVIILGIDGLRVDHIGALNSHKPSLTPALDEVLTGAAVLRDSWTPHARTFPAWVSILTGLEPVRSGAHYNLVDRTGVDDSNSLPRVLGGLGYQRIYAIDETRFSNIDETYGFDMLVTPGIGAFDFLIGTISDLPLVNILSYTVLGKWVFPWVHTNRAISVSYYPEVFDRRLERMLIGLDADRPLFLAVHYELPHWPYHWARSQSEAETPIDPSIAVLTPRGYRATVAAVDRQFAALIQGLRRHGRLEHAVLVVLSDHGEAFMGTEPTWARGSDLVNFSIPTHAGHGSNVFSEAQFRILLAFSQYGSMVSGFTPGIHEQPKAALMDIYPTLVEWLGLELPHGRDLDGLSVLPHLIGQAHPQDDRVVGLESGFSLPSIEAGNPDAGALVVEGASYYMVDDRGRLVIRKDWLPFLLSQKQRAVVYRQWILGALPVDREGKRFHLALADRDTYRFWDATSYVPDDAPLDLMMDELCRRFSMGPGDKPDFCPLAGSQER